MRKNVNNSKNTFSYSFKGKVWKYKGLNGWYFVTLPSSLGKKIRKTHVSSEEGWGRLRTSAQIKKTQWATAIWFDTKIGSYLLPLKSTVRKAESIEINSIVKVDLQIDQDSWLLITDR